MWYDLSMSDDLVEIPHLVVQVCRSSLDRAVWFTYAYADGYAIDLSDFESPGRLRAVQQFAAQRYARGRQARWRQVDEDTYEMLVVQ